jgi:hypothetical protein
MEIRNLYSVPSVIRIIKSRRMGYPLCEKCLQNFSWKTSGGLMNYIHIDFREVECEEADCIKAFLVDQLCCNEVNFRRFGVCVWSGRVG